MLIPLPKTLKSINSLQFNVKSDSVLFKVNTAFKVLKVIRLTKVACINTVSTYCFLNPVLPNVLMAVYLSRFKGLINITKFLILKRRYIVKLIK